MKNWIKNARFQHPLLAKMGWEGLNFTFYLKQLETKQKYVRLQSSDTTQRKCWPVVPVRGTKGREPLASQLIAHSVQLSTGRAQGQWRQSVALRDLTKPRIYGEQHWRGWNWERALGRRRGCSSTDLCTCVQTPPPSGKGALERMKQFLWFPQGWQWSLCSHQPGGKTWFGRYGWSHSLALDASLFTSHLKKV